MFSLRKPSGPVLRAASAVLLVVVLGAAGCSSAASNSEKSDLGTASAASTEVNDVDVMFLQMGLTQIAEGQKLATRASARTQNPAIRAVADELRTQWTDESGTMERWLLGWSKPVTADPSAEAHAGHGELHALRDADFAELDAAQGADFDRTVVSLLLGNLHNGMETLRMEASGGGYPPARSLAEKMVATRQTQIQTLLKLAA